LRVGKEQAKIFGAVFITASVSNLKKIENSFQVETDEQESHIFPEFP